MTVDVCMCLFVESTIHIYLSHSRLYPVTGIRTVIDRFRYPGSQTDGHD